MNILTLVYGCSKLIETISNLTMKKWSGLRALWNPLG
jgi:hypothetical protein